MNANKFSVAVIAGAVTLIVTGGVLYGLLLADFMEVNSAPGLMKEQPNFALLAIGEVCLAALLALILSRWQGVGSFSKGLKAGAALGFLFALGINLELYATMNLMQAITIPVDTLVNAVRMGLAGGVIGIVIGRS